MNAQTNQESPAFRAERGQGSSKVWEADPIEVLPGAAQEAARVLAAQPATELRIDRVLQLVSGFESAYGLELLSTVHWVAHEQGDSVTDEEVRSTVTSWSARKRDLFTLAHIEAATTRLRDLAWIGSSSAV